MFKPPEKIDWPIQNGWAIFCLIYRDLQEKGHAVNKPRGQVLDGQLFT